jgi:hypothetical protein
MKKLIIDLRRVIGEALTNKLGEMIGTDGPIDPYDSREIDKVLNAIMPSIDSEVASLTRMFGDACKDLGSIHEALGLHSDDAGGAQPILSAISAWKGATPAISSRFLFIAMDDDGIGHPTYCANDAAVQDAVRNSMFMPGEIPTDIVDEIKAVSKALLEDGSYYFEGDAPLHLYRLTDSASKESHHSHPNGDSL